MGGAYQPAGLTAVLVDRDGSVRSIQQHLGSAFAAAGQPEGAERAASPQGLDDPGGTMVLAGQAGLRAA